MLSSPRVAIPVHGTGSSVVQLNVDGQHNRNTRTQWYVQVGEYVQGCMAGPKLLGRRNEKDVEMEGGFIELKSNSFGMRAINGGDLPLGSNAGDSPASGRKDQSVSNELKDK